MKAEGEAAQKLELAKQAEAQAAQQQMAQQTSMDMMKEVVSKGTAPMINNAVENPGAEVLVLHGAPRLAWEGKRIVSEDIRATLRQHLSQASRKLHGARFPRLGGTALALEVDTGPDGGQTRFEVHVAPTERKRLTDAAAGVCHEEHKRIVIGELRPGDFQKGLDLVRGQDLAAVHGPQATTSLSASTGLPSIHWVEGQKLASLGECENSAQCAQNCIDAAQGRGIARLPAVLVERLDVGDPNCPNVPVEKERHQVKPDLLLASLYRLRR